jgi:restriction endonuclease Mrr
MADFGASRAYLVTTSTFTDGAQAFAIGKPITLVDGEALMARLERAGLA